MDKFNNPIFITGVERSGSTIIAKIINMCGAFSGNTTEMMENKGIKEIVDSLYIDMDCNPNGQFPLPYTEGLMIPCDWKKLINAVINKENGKGQWMYKSSRICQIWPIWNYAYPNAKWIIVRRRTGDILASCEKTAFMTAFKNEQIRKIIRANNEREGWLWWVHEHEKRFVEMIEAGVNCKVIWPERMVYGDYGQIYEMLEWVGLEWKKDIIDFVDPLLIKTRKKKGE